MICDVCHREKETTYCAPCGANICHDCQTDYPARFVAAVKANPVTTFAIIVAIILLLFIVM